MDIEIENTSIIIYSIIIMVIILFVRRRPTKFKKGVLVANTKYLKQLKYYKQLLLKYRLYSFMIFISIILLILMSSLLLSSVKITKDNTDLNSHKEKVSNNIMIYIEDDYDHYAGKEFYDYDIDEQRINKLKRIVDGLKSENIGITYRNNARMCITGTTSIDLCYFEDASIEYPRFSLDDYQNFPVVLSSFTDNIIYTKYVLDSLLSINNDNLGERLQLPFYSIDGRSEFNKYSLLLAQEQLKVFNFITAHFPKWANIYSLSNAFPGLASGNGIYFWGNSYNGYKKLTDFAIKNRNEKFMSRLSYLSFINERFERVNREYKIVIWYSDDPRVNIENEIAKNKSFCEKNNIFILPLDKYNENELINEVKKINNQHVQEITIVEEENDDDSSDDFVNKLLPWIIGITFLMFFLEWRIK